LPAREEFTAIIEELFNTRMLSNFSKYSRLLEERAAVALDHPAPLCVSSCDVGLTLAWKALECPPGEVIVPSFTFCVHRREAYRGHALRRLPVTDDLYDRLLCVPIYFELEDQQIDEIAKHRIEGVHKTARDRSAE